MDTRNSALVVGLYVAGVTVVVMVGFAYYGHLRSTAPTSMGLPGVDGLGDAHRRQMPLTAQYAAATSQTNKSNANRSLRDLQTSLTVTRESLDRSTAALQRKNAECKALKAELDQSFMLLLSLLNDSSQLREHTGLSTKDARTRLEAELEHLQEWLGKSEQLDRDRERQITELQIELIHAELEIAEIQDEARRELETLRYEKKLLDEASVQVVARCGMEAVPWLIELLGDERVEIRRWAVKALGTVGPDASEAAPFLRELLMDPDEAVRSQSQRALVALGPLASE